MHYETTVSMSEPGKPAARDTSSLSADKILENAAGVLASTRTPTIEEQRRV